MCNGGGVTTEIKRTLLKLAFITSNERLSQNNIGRVFLERHWYIRSSVAKIMQLLRDKYHRKPNRKKQMVDGDRVRNQERDEQLDEKNWVRLCLL